MSEIFDETNMKQVLGKYMPPGGSSVSWYTCDIEGNEYKAGF
jgi:hypothetical protein